MAGFGDGSGIKLEGQTFQGEYTGLIVLLCIWEEGSLVFRVRGAK